MGSNRLKKTILKNIDKRLWKEKTIIKKIDGKILSFYSNCF